MRPDAGRAAGTANRRFVELAVQQDPNRDIGAADQGQQSHHQAKRI